MRMSPESVTQGSFSSHPDTLLLLWRIILAGNPESGNVATKEKVVF